MASSEYVDQCLSIWMQAASLGQDISASELCKDCPELVGELERQLVVLRKVRDLSKDATACYPAAFATTHDLIDGNTPVSNVKSYDVQLPSIPGFEILDKLGQGGMGVVFLARQLPLNRMVALKMVLETSLARSDDKARFLAEAEAVAALHHPGIVQIYDFGTHENRPYFSLEYCPGGSLANRLAGTPMPTADAAKLVSQIAQAMNVAHEKGIIHRDLKPGNILLDANGTPKVTDFGLVKRIETDTAESNPRLTGTGAILGTPSYMAPEQARAESANIGPLTDVYAMGAILYECLTGRPPFKGATSIDTIVQVIEQEPVPIRRLNVAVPADIETICHKCLQKDPKRRFVSSIELANDLNRWQRGEPITARPVGRIERVWRWCRRNPLVAGSIGALLTVVVLGLIGLTFGLVVVAKARRTAEVERDVAKEQKRRTRNALDDMLSEESLGVLGVQKNLTPAQRNFVQRALVYYKEFATEETIEENSRKLEADAQSRVGSLFIALGQRSDAEAPLRTALALREKLVADFPNEPKNRLDLVHSHNALGQLLASLGNHADAEAAYQSARTVSQSLIGEFPNEPEYRRALARSYINLGNLLDVQSRRPEAAEVYRLALEVQGKLAAAFPNDAKYRRELGVGHHNLGLLLFNMGKWTDAETSYRSALMIRQALADEFPDVPIYQSDLARTHNNLGLLLTFGLRKPIEAEQAYRIALALRQSLATKYPAIPGYREELARSHSNLGLTLFRLGKLSEAEAVYRSALSLQSQLTNDFPNVTDNVIDLGTTYDNLGELLLKKGNADGALEFHRKAIDILTPLINSEPRMSVARKALRDAHEGAANDLMALQRLTEAVPHWDLAIEHTENSTLSKFLVGRAECLARLGRAAEVARDACRVSDDSSADPNLLFRSACALALVSAAPDDRSSDIHSQQAIELLRKAVAKGYKNLESIKTHPNLKSLHNLNEYSQFLEQLERSLQDSPDR